MGCYSFTVRDFHSLLLTGLRRRTFGRKDRSRYRMLPNDRGDRDRGKLADKVGAARTLDSSVETQIAFVRRGTSPLDETDVGAAVASTDVSCGKVELAEVGQTSVFVLSL